MPLGSSQLLRLEIPTAGNDFPDVILPESLKARCCFDSGALEINIFEVPSSRGISPPSIQESWSCQCGQGWPATQGPKAGKEDFFPVPALVGHGGPEYAAGRGFWSTLRTCGKLCHNGEATSAVGTEGSWRNGARYRPLRVPVAAEATFWKILYEHLDSPGYKINNLVFTPKQKIIMSFILWRSHLRRGPWFVCVWLGTNVERKVWLKEEKMGHLAGSASGTCNSSSQSCKFEP